MVKRVVVTLDWPSVPLSKLSQNGRLNRFAKNSAFQKFKAHAFWMTRKEIGPDKPKPAGLVSLQYHPYAPDNRKRDEDNFSSAMKAAQDGITRALGIDDFYIHLKEIIRKMDGDFLFDLDPAKKGYIEVTLEWQEK